MEVDETQGVLHLGLGQALGDFDNLGSGEAEFRVLPRAVRPLAFAGGGEFDAEADLRLHAHAAGDADDRVDFRELLDDDDGLLAEAAAHEGELDVLFVFVAVADEEGFPVLEQRECDDELGLGAGFEAEVIFFTGVEDFFDDFAELVDLDREDAAVTAFVAFFVDGLAERFVNLDDALAQHVLHADGQRGLEARGFDFLDDVGNADLPVVPLRVDAQVALRVDGEVVTSPAFEAVVVFGVFSGPRRWFAHVSRRGLFIPLPEAQGEIAPAGRVPSGSTRRGVGVVMLACPLPESSQRRLRYGRRSRVCPSRSRRTWSTGRWITLGRPTRLTSGVMRRLAHVACCS